MALFKEPPKKLIEIKLNEISTADNQRKRFDEYELFKLSESIRENGIIQPLTVRRAEKGYILVAGERRLKAARIAGLKKVPCIAINVNDKAAAVYTIIENLQREDLNLFEQAEGIERLIKRYGISKQEAADRLGIAQSTLINKLKVLRFSPDEREKIVVSNLSERNIRALIKIEDQEKRRAALDKIIAEKMCSKECEEYIEELLNPQKTAETVKPTRKSGIADVRLFSNSLNRLIDTLVAAGIKASRRKQENKDYIEYRIRIEKRERQEEKDSPQLKIC